MAREKLNRRAFLGATAMSGFALAQAGAGRALANPTGADSDDFKFEVIRTDAEWRAMLTPAEHSILRKNATELPKTNPLWNNTADGTYCCRGCNLTVYDSVWKVELDKGWAFFAQSRENSVLMGIDGQPPDGMGDQEGPGAMIEAHCRRCGSHLGHILKVGDKTLHCINGTSLQFRPAVV